MVPNIQNGSQHKQMSRILVHFRKGHVECLTKIPRCYSLKLLGVHIDTNFGFKTRIEKLSLNCRQLTFLIKRLRKHAHSIRGMQHIFNANVLPHSTYCVSVYVGVPKKHLMKLQESYYTSHMILISTEFYNNLIATCWEKICKRRNTFFKIWFLLDSYATEKLKRRPSPTNPVGF